MSYHPVTTPHTRIKKVGPRLDLARAYIRYANPDDGIAIQRQKAWDEHWFGFLSEPMFKQVLPAFHQRFGQYTSILKTLKGWLEYELEAHDFRLICHLHIQLTDPLYRWVTGTYMPQRYAEGYDEITTMVTFRQIQENGGESFSPPSLNKLSSCILSAARDNGLLKGKAKKSFDRPLVSVTFLGYLIHVLRLFQFPLSDLPTSPYIQSVVRDSTQLRPLLLEGQRRGWWEFNWGQQLFSITPRFDDLQSWYQEAIP
jgi:hypothetical protein